MEEFEQLLKEYGLGVSFVIEDNMYVLKKDLEYILDAPSQKNAFDGLVYMLKELVIRVRDFEKLNEKMNIPEKYRHLGPVIEENVCIEIGKNVRNKAEVYVLNVVQEDLIADVVRNILTKNPEKVGVNRDKLKLEMMFGEKCAILKKEVDKVMECAYQFRDDEEMLKEWTHFANQARDLLEKEPDEPEHYLRFGKYNERFRELLKMRNL